MFAGGRTYHRTRLVEPEGLNSPRGVLAGKVFADENAGNAPRRHPGLPPRCPPSARAGLERVKYNHPGLVVDLGVGLWAWPLPMDFDGDGDLDLVVYCPDKPYNGVYFFENPGRRRPTAGLQAGRRISQGLQNVQAIVRRRQAARARRRGASSPDFLKTGLEQRRRSSTRRRTSTRTRSGPTSGSYADYDGDGKLDLIVGVDDWTDYGWDDAYDAAGQLDARPAARLRLRAPQHAARTTQPELRDAAQARGRRRADRGVRLPSPNFADFDGDGDLDLLCGEFLDGFTYFENVGTRTAARVRRGPAARRRRRRAAGDGPGDDRAGRRSTGTGTATST